MPFISEAASAIKSRFGFHNPSESVRATPDVSKKSSFRENLSQFSAIRSINDRDESKEANNNKGSELVVRSFELIEEPSFWKDHNVQVIIRLRPLSSSEISQQGYSRCVRQESHQTVTWTGHPETRFTFDLVADETVSQEKLFNVAGVPMVENCVSGYNSCMFAYGQTGSGKTHTMLGDIEGGTRRHSVNCGMTPRVFEHLFSRIQKEKETRREEKMRFTCKCSFLEIYNEHILDLLNPSSSNLQIREDLKKGVYVENLTEIEVSSARDVMQQLLEGSVNRKVAATNMNHASSRSHSVFTCVIESSWESQGVTHHRFARLNLVDLAGSERQKSSGAEGERLKEATNINKSLSTLGLVIMNLVSLSNGKTLHVPYRDSKLTFLLQDSLGGNSKTIIIANISPANSCTLETLSTLKFAQRAKFIKNNAIVNEDASGDVIAMRMQIQQLKKEVTHLRSLAGGSSVQDGESMSMGLLGSPGAFKWEGLNAGAFSPLLSDRRISQKKEYEAALIGAFRRVKDKDIALQALTDENQAVMQLAKQREDEIKGLKMRLRFRESGIKRLEAVASSKISAETHLLQEKEELLKEIEVMRSQVNKKQEVTRFAMENLRLNEEIRRLKSFYEEGERERMSEQIMILENKLLEALDWKLMNEPNCTTPKEKTSTVHSAINEENEFLRLQAIHNQGEIDLLRKKLESCLDEKQKLERNLKNMEGGTEDKNGENGSAADQMELKAMVDAIAAASQREAEAHEMAITLSRENDELRNRIKVLINDNNKLIELYESAVTEINNKTNVSSAEAMVEDDNSTVIDEKVIKLEHQLTEMNEENERLMGMYEKAMLERDGSVKKIEDIEHQLLELHEENERLMSLYETAMHERDEFKKIISEEVNKAQIKLETRKQIQASQQTLTSLNTKSVDLQERSEVIKKQFSALKFSLSNICSSTGYFEEREAKARGRVESAVIYINQIKDELTSLEVRKGEIEAAVKKNEQDEVEVEGNLDGVRLKLEEESRKLESDKVLFEIDNVDNRSWKLGTTELLKSAEEKTKLQNEVKQCEVKLRVIRKEGEGLKMEVMRVESEIKRVGLEMEKGLERREKMEIALNNVISEKEILMELKESGKVEVDEMVVKFQECVFDEMLNGEERRIVEDEVSGLVMKLEKLEGEKGVVMKKVSEELNEGGICSFEKMKGEVEEVEMCNGS